MEVNEVFLRYRSGDARLADEVLERSDARGNEWVARRAMARSVRTSYTNELSERGVKKPQHFAICTNETYLGLFDATAKTLKTAKGIKSGSLRDGMSMKELAFIAASEALSVERMEEEASSGFSECRTATSRSANAIRSAIDSDRNSRQKRLV